MNRIIWLLQLSVICSGCFSARSQVPIFMQKRSDLEDARLHYIIWIRSNPSYDFDIYVADKASYVVRKKIGNENSHTVAEIDDPGPFLRFAKSVESAATKKPPFPPPGPSIIVIRLANGKPSAEKTSYLSTGDHKYDQTKFVLDLNDVFRRARKSEVLYEKLSNLVPADWFEK